MGAAVGLAVLRYLQAHDLVAASARMGALLLEPAGRRCAICPPWATCAAWA